MRVLFLYSQLGSKLFAMAPSTPLGTVLDPMTCMLVQLVLHHRGVHTRAIHLPAGDAYIALNESRHSVVEWVPGCQVEQELAGQLAAFIGIVRDLVTRAGLLPSVNIAERVREGIACTLLSLLPESYQHLPSAAALRATGLLALTVSSTRPPARIVARSHMTATVLPLLEVVLRQYTPGAAAAPLPAAPAPLSVTQQVTERITRYIDTADAQYMALSRAEAQVILRALQNQPQAADEVPAAAPQQAMQRRLFLD